ncbi:MAG: hypothetical protein A2096_13840 [Spirochaetes bacterium GWF1_41_5]|nr:MAG: hypothetical protein A2096_13840 [Spirochaetes bacterium GWF1_41_5]HBE02278.1 anti-sigma factor antagonist [Spirochaetia bacterium]
MPEINSIVENNICTIKVRSAALNEKNSIELEDIIAARHDQGIHEFLIDFSETKFIDSRGLGKLLCINKAIEEDGGKLKICRISDLLDRAFDNLQIYSVIEKDESFPAGNIAD